MNDHYIIYYGRERSQPYSLPLTLSTQLVVFSMIMLFLGDYTQLMTNRSFIYRQATFISLIVSSSNQLNSPLLHLYRISGPPPYNSFRNRHTNTLTTLQSSFLCRFFLHFCPSSKALLSIGPGIGYPLLKQAKSDFLYRKFIHFLIQACEIITDRDVFSFSYLIIFYFYIIFLYLIFYI